LTLKKSHTTSQFFFFAEFIQPLGIIKKPNNESKTHQRHARLDKSDLQVLHISRSITYINKFNNPACSPSPKSSQTIQNFITKQFSHSWLLEYQQSDFTSQAMLDSTMPNSNFCPRIYIICTEQFPSKIPEKKLNRRSTHLTPPEISGRRRQGLQRTEWRTTLLFQPQYFRPPPVEATTQIWATYAAHPQILGGNV